MTFYEFNQKFPTEEAAINYFYKIRYNGVLRCPHCESKVNLYRTSRQKVCICHFCENTFSPFADTIFRKSTTDLRKWFYAIHLVLNAKKGISACHLQREIGTIYRTAWRMLHKIRLAMGNENMSKAFEFLVEIDETYIGGKPRKNNVQIENGVAITKRKRGRGTDKTPVIGVKERRTRRVYAQVALPNAQGQKLTGKQLLAVLDKVCKNGTTVVSDDFSGYNILNNMNKYYHLTVKHSIGQFSAGNGVHTNNIENFWSLIKRQYIGTHHHYSVKYMQNYIDEMCFRQNHIGYDAFDTLLGQSFYKAS